jgi:polyhydroxyalkanoate synthase
MAASIPPPRILPKPVRKAVDKTVLSVVNALVYLVDGGQRQQMGNASKELVLKHDKLELWRIKPVEAERVELGHAEVEVDFAPRLGIPLLLIPPLMVRPYVYDLRPDHSMIRQLRNAGFDVYLVDFGVPDTTDEGLRLDDYVLDFVPRCVDAALAHANAKELALVGYCMGGLFSLIHTAAFRDERIRAIVTIAAPVDFERMGMLTVAARLGAPFVDVVMDRLGNVPGNFSSTGFKLMGGPKMLTRYVDLALNLWDEEYVKNHDAVDTWLTDMIPYPKEAFKQLVRDMVTGNRLVQNELRFGDRHVDLRAIQCPVLAFAGKSDNVATPRSTQRILDVLGTKDKTYRLAPGGHIGVVAGSKAPGSVWDPAVEWLVDRILRKRP